MRGLGSRWYRAHGLLLATVTLAGCRVGPKYVKPVVPLYQAPELAKDAYKEVDPDWIAAQPSDANLRGDWWVLFHDPLLSHLEALSVFQNQTLRQYEARYTQAQAQIGINRADLYPTLGTNVSASGLRESAGRPYFSAANLNSGVADLQLPLSLSYEADLWGRVRRNIDLAKEEAQASDADLATARLSVQTTLAMDYFEVRTADAQVKLLADTVKDYQEALRITTNRFQGGIISESDVFQARTQLQSAIVQQSDVAVNRAQFEHAIAVLIGQPPNSFSIPVSPLETTPPVIPMALPSQLLERRPDIAAAERRTAEANQRVGIARVAYFPRLGFTASGGYEAGALGNFFAASNAVYALGPTLGYTFFDGGRRASISQQALAQFDEASATYKQTTLTAFQQVEDNLAALRILAREAQQQHEGTVAAQGAQKIFDNRYVGGIDTYLQVVTAQQAALTNERNEIDILRRRMDASVLLIKALGGGWSTAEMAQFGKMPQP